jgi:hypothetical protein
MDPPNLMIVFKCFARGLIAGFIKLRHFLTYLSGDRQPGISPSALEVAGRKSRRGHCGKNATANRESSQNVQSPARDF